MVGAEILSHGAVASIPQLHCALLGVDHRCRVRDVWLLGKQVLEVDFVYVAAVLLHRVGALFCILLVQGREGPIGGLTSEESVVVALAAAEGNSNLKVVIVLVL